MGPLILCYHAVSERWPASLSVTPAAFEKQLRTLAARGFSSVGFTDAVVSPRSKTVAVTFDDGFRSVLEVAYPVLNRLGMAATLFVPTDWPGRSPQPMAWPGIDQWLDGPHRDECAPLAWDEIRWLADRGWEIGSHTCSHPHLTQVADAQLDDELRRSKADCAEQLGRPCTSIAYPYGDHDGSVVNSARNCGYTAAGTLPARLRHGGPLAQPRIGIYREDHDQRFRLKVAPAGRLLRSLPVWPG